MTMPRMTGAELVKEILCLKPDQPIILCTGFSEKIDLEKARAMGVRGFLLKPVVVEELAALVRGILDKQMGRR
jgi:CheY-like chemotaxis protein